MTEYKVDEVVIYQNGNSFELGIVKEVLGDDKYRVWYHTGDTSSVTPSYCLHKIVNGYAFTILRKQEDNYLSRPLTCRSIAAEILSPFEFTGDNYYKLEDWLTAKLEGYKFPFPAVQSAYLEAALRIEVRDILDMNDFVYDTDSLDSIVEELMTSYSESPLNNQFIQDYVIEYGDKFLVIGGDVDE